MNKFLQNQFVGSFCVSNQVSVNFTFINNTIDFSS
jgi:hypothetical protein